MRELPSKEQFKFYLHEKKNKKNTLYYYGKHWPQVHHSHIKIGCSNLKHDLCFNLHVINDPICECGADIEVAQHFFLNCPSYTDLCLDLFNQIAPFSAPT